MANLVNRDLDGDGVKELDWLRILKVVIPLLILGLPALMLMSNVPTAPPAVVGMLLLLLQLCGILFFPLIAPYLLFRALKNSMAANKESDVFERKKLKTRALLQLIIAILMLVFATVTWIIFIGNSIAHAALAA
ncbi:MAG: hypothetical protein JWO55_419 [Candidatus Saccharibacteria bacterium]|jgi:hypothetical protein|nr:hypothetical protein [Candidatus Saccharibacteria bacterium]